MNQQSYWPDRTERKLLGLFYVAEGISETLNVVYTFRFIYLYMVMERPEWAVLALFVEAAIIFLMEIPTGVVADYWGRKASVISSGLLYALSLALIPYAVSFNGLSQLWLVCLLGDNDERHKQSLQDNSQPYGLQRHGYEHRN